MKMIIVIGGFAKRLWPSTKSRSKCLPPTADKPILLYVSEKVHRIERIDEIYVSINKGAYGILESVRMMPRRRSIRK